MSDHFIPIRQYVPPSPSPASTVNPYFSKQETTDGSDLSFQDVLSRQMQSSVQIQQMQTPPVEIPQPNYFATGTGFQAKHYNTGPIGSGIVESIDDAPISDAPDSPMMESMQEIPASGLGKTSIMQSVEELPGSSELIPKAPDRIPQGRELENIMLQNATEYRQMKKIPDLSTGAVPSMSNSMEKPRISPAYSAYDLSNSSLKPLSDKGSTPINADMMKQDPDESVLMQADVQPIDQSGNKRMASSSKGRWTESGNEGNSTQLTLMSGSGGSEMSAKGTEGEVKWNATIARARRYRESSKPWHHQKIRMPRRPEARMTQQESTPNPMNTHKTTTDYSMQSSYDLNA